MVAQHAGRRVRVAFDERLRGEAFARNWKSSTVWGARLWIPMLALPLGFGLYTLQLVADLVALHLRLDTPFGLEDK